MKMNKLKGQVVLFNLSFSTCCARIIKELKYYSNIVKNKLGLVCFSTFLERRMVRRIFRENGLKWG